LSAYSSKLSSSVYSSSMGFTALDTDLSGLFLEADEINFVDDCVDDKAAYDGLELKAQTVIVKKINDITNTKYFFI